MTEKRIGYEGCMGKPEGKAQLERPRLRWTDNAVRILKSVRCDDSICDTGSAFNLLKTKRNLLYIRNQSVPRSKHFPPQL